MIDQEKIDAIMEELMERKGRIVDSLMIEMLLSFIISKDLDDELNHFSIMWMADKIRQT